MLICSICNQEFTQVNQKIKYKKFCTNKCYLVKWRRDIKAQQSDSYFKRLKYSSNNARKKVRLRKGLPLDHPHLYPNYGRKYKMKYGYKLLLLKDHPNTTKDGYVMEHVVVMSEFLGRPLQEKETVHHKNGIRDDNRIENLELWSKSHPFGQRVKDKIAWCKEFLEQYGHKVIIEENCSSRGIYGRTEDR